jgi:hypothetical protein
MTIEPIIEPTDGFLQRGIENTADTEVIPFFQKTVFLKATPS